MKLITRSVVLQLIIGALIKAFIPESGILESYLAWTTFSVIGLFMSVGLHLHFKKFEDDIIICTVLVLVTTLFPYLMFYGVGILFHQDKLSALTIAVVLVTTGTGVTIQTLSNLGKLHTRTGEFLTLVSALDDIPAAIVMAFLLGQGKVLEGRLLNPLWPVLAIGLAGVILAISHRSFRGKRWIYPALILGFAVSLAYLLEAFHITLVMGGLIAGILITFLTKGEAKRAEPELKKFLNPILFFYMIFIGMKLTPTVFQNAGALSLAVSLTVVGIFSKWFFTWLILKGREDIDSLSMAWGMVPRGIPGFAFAATALAGGLITEEIFTVLIFVVSITTWIGLLGLELRMKRVS